jgi:hypothetical protein
MWDETSTNVNKPNDLYRFELKMARMDGLRLSMDIGWIESGE